MLRRLFNCLDTANDLAGPVLAQYVYNVYDVGPALRRRREYVLV